MPFYQNAVCDAHQVDSTDAWDCVGQICRVEISYLKHLIVILMLFSHVLNVIIVDQGPVDNYHYRSHEQHQSVTCVVQGMQIWCLPYCVIWVKN